MTLVPFAATVPCELWLLPKRHQADFGQIESAEVNLLATALRDALIRLGATLHEPSYNYVIDSAPKGEAGSTCLHWRLRVVPQSTAPGGFELASGLAINPSLPEQDAAILRSCNPTFEAGKLGPSTAHAESRPSPPGASRRNHATYAGIFGSAAANLRTTFA